MDPIPPISKIFSYVVQQERQFIGHNFFNHYESNVVVAINTVNCSYCGNSGHTENVCFKKNGFPSKNSGNRKVCVYCGKNGHTVEICYKKHGFPPGHKMYNGKSKGYEAKDDGIDKEMCLTQKQYQALMAPINQNFDHVES